MHELSISGHSGGGWTARRPKGGQERKVAGDGGVDGRLATGLAADHIATPDGATQGGARYGTRGAAGTAGNHQEESGKQDNASKAAQAICSRYPTSDAGTRQERGEKPGRAVGQDGEADTDGAGDEAEGGGPTVAPKGEEEASRRRGLKPA